MGILSRFDLNYLRPSHEVHSVTQFLRTSHEEIRKKRINAKLESSLNQQILKIAIIYWSTIVLKKLAEKLRPFWMNLKTYSQPTLCSDYIDIESETMVGFLEPFEILKIYYEFRL